MKKRVSILLVFFLTACVSAPVRRASQGLRISPSWFGVVPGVSEEANVVALYGEGYFTDELGDTGMRTYTARSDSAALTFIFGIDKLVEDIVFERHRSRPLPKEAEARATVDLEPKGWFGWTYASLLGQSPQRIRELLGEPEQTTTGEWLYFVNGCEECGDVTLQFENGTVERLTIQASME